MIYGYPVLYQPTAAPKEAPPIPDQRKALAKRAGASHISADGLKAYKRLLGRVYEADWLEDAFGVWWPYGEKMPEGAIEV